MERKKERKKAGGFTLVELLVVISIIALLLAILMPSLAKARKQAKYTVCMSNQRQSVNAFLIYAESNDNKLPDRIGMCKVDSAPIVQAFYASMWTWPDTLMQPLKPYLGDNLNALGCRNSNAPWKTPVQFYSEHYGMTGPGSDLWFSSYVYLVGMASKEHFGDPPSYWMDSSKRPFSAADIKLSNNRSDKLVLVDATMHSGGEGWAIINHPKRGRDEFGDVFGDKGPFLSSRGLRDMIKYPEGSNRAHVDGSIKKVRRNVMTTNDLSLDDGIYLGHWSTGPGRGITFFW